MLLQDLFESTQSLNAFRQMHKKIEQLARMQNTPAAKQGLVQWTQAVDAVKQKIPGNQIHDGVPDEIISRLLVIGEGIIRTLSGTVSQA